MVMFWATFVFFTLSGSRRSYYILPILPAAAILDREVLKRPLRSVELFHPARATEIVPNDGAPWVAMTVGGPDGPSGWPA
jgi:hypothetical protein